MKLQKIKIKNYKGIGKELEIDLSVKSNKAKENLKNQFNYELIGTHLIPKVLGIMGKNASGKTSILTSFNEILNFVFNTNNIFTRFYSQKLSFEIFGKNPQHQMEQMKQDESLDLRRSFNMKINEFRVLSFENQKKLFPEIYHQFMKETYWTLSNDQVNPLTIELTFVKSIDKYVTGFEMSSNKLKTWKYKNNDLIQKFPPIKFTSLNYNYYNFFNINVLLQNQIKLLNTIGERKYNVLIKMIDNNIEKINTNKKENKLFFHNFIMKNKAILDYSFLSSGTIKILDIISLIMEENNNELSLLIGDEINNFLHGKLVGFLFKLFNHYSNKKQLLFSTHSPSVISQIDRHSILLLDTREEGEVILQKGSKIREENNFYKKFISEEISSHPSTSEMNEVLYEWSK